MEIILTLAIVVGATAGILNLSRFTQPPSFSVSRLEYIDAQLKYQALLLGVAILVLLAIYFLNKSNFESSLSIGDVSAPAKGVSWLGISQGESWLNLGTSLSFFITLATTMFVFLQFRKLGPNLWQNLPFLPWALLFSITNSFSEEVIYRLGVVVPLAGAVNQDYILLLSATAFGLPHLRGMPSGIVGAFMAGLLGWLLAKSLLKTNGIFWAWFIHFLQDIIIFTGFVMTAAPRKPR